MKINILTFLFKFLPIDLRIKPFTGGNYVMKKYLLLICFIVLTFHLLGFAGGSGTILDPYQVSTLSDLNDVRNYPSSVFMQMNDIDASTTSTWDNGAGFTPIGNTTTPFTGAYDGLGYSVSNLFISSVTSDIGIFGYADGAFIFSLNIIDCNISGVSRVGALVGQIDNGHVDRCSSSGEVSARWSAGGLVGKCNNTEVKRSYSAALVTSVSTGDRRGGLVGNALSGSVIENCYARGNVIGYTKVGGLVGSLSNSDIINSYSTGQVTTLSTGPVGGLTAYIDDTCSVVNSYWDTETSLMSTSALGEGKTTAELGYLHLNKNNGWDFSQETINGTDDIWDISTANNNGYPYFTWDQSFSPGLTAPSGSGTSTNKYQIASLMDLWWISSNPGEWDKYYVQTSDIDAADTDFWNDGNYFSPIGNNSVHFTGSYDGQLRTITGLKSSQQYYSGFFGYTDGAYIGNIRLVGNYSTGQENVGLLAGYVSGGVIEHCSTSGQVFSEISGGGFIGLCDGAIITKSYSSADAEVLSSNLQTGYFFGSFIGKAQSSTISYCYSTGNSIAISYYGALVGWIENSTLEQCYSTGIGQYHIPNITAGRGLVGHWNQTTATGCFWWDNNLVNISSLLGTKATATEMQSLYTFHGAGWDFREETVNGQFDTWDIGGSVNNGFPYLTWDPEFPQSLSAPTGVGYSNAPYQISTLYDLWWVSSNDHVWDNYFEQIADINAYDTHNWNEGEGFYPIGPTIQNYFSGTYDGQGYTISNLFIDRPGSYYIGLFGRISASEIHDLNIENAEITGSMYTGIICGRSFSSTIENCTVAGIVTGSSNSGVAVGTIFYSHMSECHSTGAISGGDYIGGLVGSMGYSDVNLCSSDAEVNGSSKVGGLIGIISSQGEIFNCYSKGNVNGLNDTGGLVGKHEGNIIQNCYTTAVSSGEGLVGTRVGSDNIISSCFYNTDISPSGTLGTGLTTAEMKSLNTYAIAGWDLVGETLNGTNDYWIIPPFSYPQFYTEDVRPVITSVRDFPGDQGHQVELIWDKSDFDYIFDLNFNYSIWRLSDNLISIDDETVVLTSFDQFSVPEEDENNQIVINIDNQLWTFIAVVPAVMNSAYSYIAPTHIDSIYGVAPQEYEATFKVLYSYNSGFLTSESATGYSVDNIAPYATNNVQVSVSDARNTFLTLSWDEVTEGGFNGNSYPERNGIWYRIYAGDNPDFNCIPANLLTITQNTSYDVDISRTDSKYFKVVVSDQP